jgi:hypothetical protein
MEDMAYRYGISSYRQAARGSPPAWGLGMELTTPDFKNNIVEKCYIGPQKNWIIRIFARYNYNDQTKKNVMGRACSMHVGDD